MALASTSIHASIAFRCNSISAFSNSVRLRFFENKPPPNHIHPRLDNSRSVLAFARRRSTNSAVTSSSSKKKKKSQPRNDIGEDGLDEDAFEALFNQLEEDLKNDGLSIDDNDDEISEEDLAKLERELEEALGGDGELLEMLDSISDDKESENDAREECDDEEDDDEEEKPVKLKNWQLRRMAYALKTGRRKTSIKNLAAELCLDRTVVLELLRDPPPNLLLMSAALPDKPAPTMSEPEPERESIKNVPAETTKDAAEPVGKVNVPVHVMQSQWSAQKRLKKVHVETLEKVYRRSKRPTNAMISSIVQVTNLPRKRVVKWFEDKRAEDGVPDNHSPYRRSATETVFST